MEIDTVELISSANKLFGEMNELELEIVFIHLLKKPQLVKKANAMRLLRLMINRNIQYGNYRSAIRYLLLLKLLVKEMQKYSAELKDIITNILLKNSEKA